MVQALGVIRILALLVLGSAVSGCLFEGTRRGGPAAYRDVSVSTNDEAWGTYTVTPAKPQSKKAARLAAPAQFRPRASATTAEDDCGTPDQCALTLKLMIEDTERRWIPPVALNSVLRRRDPPVRLSRTAAQVEL